MTGDIAQGAASVASLGHQATDTSDALPPSFNRHPGDGIGFLSTHTYVDEDGQPVLIIARGRWVDDKYPPYVALMADLAAVPHVEAEPVEEIDQVGWFGGGLTLVSYKLCPQAVAA